MAGFISRPMNMTAQPSPATQVSLEAAHGAHVFEVANYSRHRDLGVGSFLRSANFHVSGCAWSIRFYPCGVIPDADYVSIGLELTTRDAMATVSFDLQLIDNATGARCTEIGTSKVEYDTRCVEGFVRVFIIERFMRKSELEASAYLRDDRLVIECTLRVIKGTWVTEVRAAAPDIQVPPSELPGHMGRLLKDGHGTDLTFEVQGRSFPAHRWLLAARSPAFKAELLGPMKEGSVDRIAVHEIKPQVFDWLGICSLPPNRYGLDRLKLVCEKTLSRSLTVENVTCILVLADRHTCSGLKDACFEFMTFDRMDDVKRTEGYGRLKRDHPHVLIALLDRVVQLGKI